MFKPAMSSFTQDGLAFTMTVHHDDGHGIPWEQSDCHGIITDWERRAKQPHERILCSHRGLHRFYDMRATTAKARSQGWGSTEAIDQDFERLRAWTNDEWWYVGVAVTVSKAGIALVGPYDHALWGIESDAVDYITEVANTDLLPEARTAALFILKELAS